MGRVGHTVGVSAMLFLCSGLQCVGLAFQEGVAAGLLLLMLLLLLLLLLRARGAGFAVAVFRPVSLVRQLWGRPQAEIKLCLAFDFFGTEEVRQVVVGQVFVGRGRAIEGLGHVLALGMERRT